MEKAGQLARLRFLVSPKWLGWHAFAVVAFLGMCWLGYWQYRRAMSGNPLSWAYTFEWPLFAIFGAVFWGKTIRDEFRIRSGKAMRQAGESPVPDGTGEAVPGVRATVPAVPDSMAGGGGEPEDDELAAYNAYLATLHDQVKHHGRWHGLR
jgi:hypothetical protein